MSKRRRKDRPRTRTKPKMHTDNDGSALCGALTTRITQTAILVTCDECKRRRQGRSE